MVQVVKDKVKRCQKNFERQPIKTLICTQCLSPTPTLFKRCHVLNRVCVRCRQQNLRKPRGPSQRVVELRLIYAQLQIQIQIWTEPSDRTPCSFHPYFWSFPWSLRIRAKLRSGTGNHGGSVDPPQKNCLNNVMTKTSNNKNSLAKKEKLQRTPLKKNRSLRRKKVWGCNKQKSFWGGKQSKVSINKKLLSEEEKRTQVTNKKCPATKKN